jgi:hypothetical protein
MALRLFWSWRLDVLLATTLGSVAAPGLASGLHRVARLALAARLAKGSEPDLQVRLRILSLGLLREAA